MAKIIKVGPATHTPIANPFRTSRNSTTNPFKYSNFEGNTLQFADVFEGFEPKNTSKLRMIAASVAGSMHKLRTGITEPIINFVNRVRGGITTAWDYAINTNVSDLPGMKAINDFMNMEIPLPECKIISDSIGGIKSKLSGGIDLLNTNVLDLGKIMTDKWTSMVTKIHQPKVSAELSVAELENLWKSELELEGAV